MLAGRHGSSDRQGPSRDPTVGAGVPPEFIAKSNSELIGSRDRRRDDTVRPEIGESRLRPADVRRSYIRSGAGMRAAFTSHAPVRRKPGLCAASTGRGLQGVGPPWPACWSTPTISSRSSARGMPACPSTSIPGAPRSQPARLRSIRVESPAHQRNRRKFRSPTAARCRRRMTECPPRARRVVRGLGAPGRRRLRCSCSGTPGSPDTSRWVIAERSSASIEASSITPAPSSGPR